MANTWKIMQNKLTALRSGLGVPAGAPVSTTAVPSTSTNMFSKLFAGSTSTYSTSSASAQMGSKVIAFPIVGIMLIITIIVLYSTGRASSQSIYSLSGLAIACLFASLLYAFYPGSGGGSGAGAGPGFNWKGFALMVLSATVALFVILLIVHYTIKPIFKIKDAGPGMIPVPTVGKESSGFYWTKTAGSLNSSDTVLGATDDGTFNYSMTIDILIKDPNVSSNIDRPILTRSDSQFTPAPVSVEGVSIIQQVGNYNLAMYLDKSTNDLIVSTMSTTATGAVIENVLIENVPVQKPFRVGVIMGNRYMEVYYNGKLHSTRQLAGPPLAVSGTFIPPTGNFAVMADVRNLRIWKGVITPPEMSYLPALSIADFGEQTQRSLSQIAGNIAGAAGCGISGVADSVLADAQSNMGGALELLGNIRPNLLIPGSASLASGSASASASMPSVPSTNTSGTGSASASASASVNNINYDKLLSQLSEEHAKIILKEGWFDKYSLANAEVLKNIIKEAKRVVNDSSLLKTDSKFIFWTKFLELYDINKNTPSSTFIGALTPTDIEKREYIATEERLGEELRMTAGKINVMYDRKQVIEMGNKVINDTSVPADSPRRKLWQLVFKEININSPTASMPSSSSSFMPTASMPTASASMPSASMPEISGISGLSSLLTGLGAMQGSSSSFASA
jgi:hypothetical protein